MKNPPFEKHLEMIAAEFRENIQKYEKIHLLHHSDADGICSGQIIKYLIQKYRKNPILSCLNLSESWESYLPKIKLDRDSENAVIFSDLCPSGALITEYAEKYPNTHFFILDHHRFKWPEDIEPPENVYNANPTLFGLHGLKEIVGSALNYLFAVKVDESLSKWAWLAAIGIAGDTLNHIDEYQSYNLEVVEHAQQLEQVEKRTGLCLYGGQHLRLDAALSFSIFPYIPSVEGSKQKARKMLSSLSLDPSQKIEDLTLDEAEKIAALFPDIKLIGDYLILPKKNGLLRYTFEHAQIISIFGHDSPAKTVELINRKSVSQEAKSKYNLYITGLVQNLTKFMHLPKIETNSAIFVDLTGEIPKSQWSDTGSFASVNHIYNEDKMLFIGGMNDPEEYKFSVRCTPKFINEHQGHGAVHLIKEFTAKFGGSGGGHGLAAGIRIPPALFQTLTENIDMIIENFKHDV